MFVLRFSQPNYWPDLRINKQAILPIYIYITPDTPVDLLSQNKTRTSENNHSKMSVFSKLRLSKKAADEHKAAAKAKETEAQAAQSVAKKYHHVPTHARIDSQGIAPQEWKEVDRPVIKQINRDASIHGMSRTTSMLSTTSNMNSIAISEAGSSKSFDSTGRRDGSAKAFQRTWSDPNTFDVTRKPPPRSSSYSQITGYKGNSYGRHSPRRARSHRDSGFSNGPSPLSTGFHSEGKFFKLCFYPKPNQY